MRNSSACESIQLLAFKSKISEWEVLIKKSKENKEKVEALKLDIKKAQHNKGISERCIQRLRNNVKRVETYLAERKEAGLVGINTAILASRSVIPYGAKIRLDYQPGNTSLVDEDGLNANKAEGSGFRAMTSLFIRRKLLDVTEHIQTIILDEPLSTLDPENSAEVSKYINAMALNAPVILIEQKPEVFLSTENLTTYHFDIEDGTTRVRKAID